MFIESTSSGDTVWCRRNGEACREVASSLFAGTASTVFSMPSLMKIQVMMRVQETLSTGNQRVREQRPLKNLIIGAWMYCRS